MTVIPLIAHLLACGCYLRNLLRVIHERSSRDIIQEGIIVFSYLMMIAHSTLEMAA